MIDTGSLDITLLGQTASHSWSTSIQLSDDKSHFIGYEQGDNFPRGLQTWIIYHEKLDDGPFIPNTNVFYQYKALHCTMEEAEEYVSWGGPARPLEYTGAEYDDGSRIGTKFAK